MSKSARRTGSVSSGAFVLARAGLLDGKRATTHWNSTEHLATQFPDITVKPDSIYVKDGSIYTSVGVTAGMDLVWRRLKRISTEASRLKLPAGSSCS